MQKKVDTSDFVFAWARGTHSRNPFYSANGKLKPLWAMVDGRPEHHPEGTYHLRYHRKIHPSVGNRDG